MEKSKRALSNNRMANSPHYGKILKEYNDRFERDGKVNNLAFYKEIVAPLIPGYGLASWYQFMNRFKTTAGLAVANVMVSQPSTPAGPETIRLENTMMSNQAATQKGIQTALTIGARAMNELLENVHLLSPKDRAELLFKAMKAQDSRIHSLGKIREDNREQARFDRAFDSAAYE